jgi:hypothetical protein
MSFPRKHDGSLDLVAFDALPLASKKEAITALRAESPDEALIVKQHIVTHQQKVATRIAEADATVAALEAKNRALLIQREKLVTDFTDNTNNALREPQANKKSSCSIM